MASKVAWSAFALLVGLPSLGTVAGRSDVLGAVRRHHLTVRVLEVFSHSGLLSCVFLLCPKALGSEMMAARAPALAWGQPAEGGELCLPRNLALLGESQGQ